MRRGPHACRGSPPVLTSHRSNSRVRFETYKLDRRKKSTPPLTPGGRSRPAPRAGTARCSACSASSGASCARIVVRSSRRLAALSVATLLKMVPPASTKFVIDYVLASKPLPGRHAAEPGGALAPPTAVRGFMSVVLVISLARVGVALWSRWIATRTTKRVQMEMRRRAFSHAARLPAAPGLQPEIGWRVEACSARTPGASASSCSACSITPRPPSSSSSGVSLYSPGSTGGCSCSRPPGCP